MRPTITIRVDHPEGELTVTLPVEDTVKATLEPGCGRGGALLPRGCAVMPPPRPWPPLRHSPTCPQPEPIPAPSKAMRGLVLLRCPHCDQVGIRRPDNPEGTTTA